MFIRIGLGTFRVNDVVSVTDSGDAWHVRLRGKQDDRREVYVTKSEGETIERIHDELDRKSRPTMDASSPQGPGGLT